MKPRTDRSSCSRNRSPRARTAALAPLGAALALLLPASALADDAAEGAERADERQEEPADEEPPEEEDGAAIDRERRSPLAGEPAIRNRPRLTSQRLEISPSFEGTINAPYRHTLSGGVKGEYHITSTWSVGVLGLFGQSFNTGLTNRILDDLPADPGDAGEPSETQFRESLNSMPVRGAAYVGFKPFYGKLAAFGSLFLNYNIYFSGGASAAVLENECCSFQPDSNDGDPRTDPPDNEGTEVGFFAGVGAQVFLSDFLALDLSVRDYYFRNNPSGASGAAQLTDDDHRFRHHITAGLGVSLFFPREVDRTP